MAKISLRDPSTGYLSATNHAANNSDLETQFNDKVLYRDNPTGEDNAMQNDLDMNSNDILNAKAMNVQSLSINGTQVIPTGTVAGEIPTQTGNSGKYLTTNGTSTSWDTLDGADINYDIGETGSVSRTLGAKLGDIVTATDFGAISGDSTDDSDDIIEGLAVVQSLLIPVGTFELAAVRTLSANNELYGLGTGSVLLLTEDIANGASALTTANNNRFRDLYMQIPAQSANTNQLRAILVKSDDVSISSNRFLSNREGSYPILLAEDINRILILGNQFEVLANGPLWKPNFASPASETYQGAGFVAVANMMKGANSQGRIGISIDGNCVGSSVMGNHAYNFQGEGASQGFAYAIANDGQVADNMSGIMMLGNIGHTTQDEVFHGEDACNGVFWLGNAAINGTDGFYFINTAPPRNLNISFNFARDLSERGIYVAGSGSSSDVNVIGNIIENFGTGGASDGILIGQGASSHVNVLANIVDQGTGDGLNIQPNTKTNIAYNITRGVSDDGIVLNGPTESVYIESNNILSDATGGPIDESTVNGVSGDKDIYVRDITVGSAQTIVLGHFRRPAVVTRLEIIYQEATDGVTAQTFDLGVNGDASLYSAGVMKDAAPGASAYDVDNFTTFVSRTVAAGSVVTLDLNAGSDSTFKVTCRLNYFEYS